MNADTPRSCGPSTPLAWRKEPIYSQLKQWAIDGWRQGELVVAMSSRRVWVITSKEDIDLGDLDERTAFSVEEQRDGSVRVVLRPVSTSTGG